LTRFACEVLGPHARGAFSSGNAHIDRHFGETASQDVKRSHAACFVLVERHTDRIAGFYTLSAHSVPLTEVGADPARKLPRYPSVPAMLIGWMDGP
jgi:hypothetical protein